MRERVVIVGGGMAGLAAAVELAGRYSVTVLEARERFGGRILTVRGPGGIPYELGAEFVHGRAPEVLEFVREAKLKTHEAADRHWKFVGGDLVEVPDFWEQLESVTAELKPGGPDMSFARFVGQQRKPAEAIKLAKEFVQGFHAAPLEKASAQATRLTEESSEENEGDADLRIGAGYDRLVEYVEGLCRKSGVSLRCGARVVALNWSGRRVRVKLCDEELEAECVIVTVPIGVLQGGAIAFTPRPIAKFGAIESLKMGMVTKVVLHFRERFWPNANFGFIHSDDEWFGTWWSGERGEILTAWAGGPNGEKLARFEQEFIVERALEGGAKIFGESLPRVREILITARTHNWKTDPFSRGAYSYIPVNGTDACHELARPEEDRLFFGGEATDLNYQFGTVHGAIASGIRAAKQLRQSLSA